MKYNRDNLPQFLFCGAISNYSENRVDEHSNKWSTLNNKETPPLLSHNQSDDEREVGVFIFGCGS